MKYDFENMIDRYGQCATKWVDMEAKNPEHDKSIVPFSVADMEFKVAPEIREGLKDYLDNHVLGYTILPYSYTDAVCGWMKKRHDWEVKREWITVSPGVVPAIYDTVRAFTEEGDGVILLTPVYYPFSEAIRRNGRKIVDCPLIRKDDKYTIDFELLEEKAKQPDVKLILFCSPHNPVGRVWTQEELEKVGRICIDNDVVIVSDEIHFDLVMKGYHHTVMANISEEFSEKIITCTAPSKSFNLAGMLTSAVIIKNKELRERFATQQGKSGFYQLNLLGYRACEIAYNECEEWLGELLQVIELNYKTLKEYLAKELPQVKVYPLEGTYLVWMDWNGLGMSPKELEDFMVNKAKVFFDEGYIFGEPGEGFERMNIACPTEVMLTALKRIVTEWNKLNH